MITVSTLPMSSETVREAYNYLRYERLISAIKAMRGGMSWLGLRQAKELCEAMRDGRRTGTFFISDDTAAQITELLSGQQLDLSAAQSQATGELHAAAAGYMSWEQAGCVVEHWPHENGLNAQQVQVKAWESEEDDHDVAPGRVARDISPMAPPVGPSAASSALSMPIPERVRRARPQCAEPGTARRRLADELKAAWRRAGEPPYRKLRRDLEGEGFDGAASIASISKALSGSTGRPPSWALVRGLLKLFGTPDADLNGFWLPLWGQAREEVAPLGVATAATTAPSTVVPVISLVPQSNKETDDKETGSAGHPAAAGFECEDCGAWVVNADRHYAWHWTMEKQLRRALVRRVESTGS